MSIRSRFFSKRTLLADRLLYATPAALGMEAREASFPGAGGVVLRGWLIPGRRRGVIVFCPGTVANVSAHLEYARMAASTGRSVLCLDYRGFGRSDGEPDLRFVARDIASACGHARAAFPGQLVGIFGISLGAGAALLAGARAGGTGGGTAEVAGVAAEGVSDIRWMLEGLFREGAFGPSRVREIVGPDGVTHNRERVRVFSRRLPRPLPRWAAAAGSALYPFDAKSLPGIARRLQEVPVLLIHGIEDLLLPFEAAIDLHRLLPGPKRLWLIPDVGHAQEAALAAGREYARQLESFFDAAFEGRPLDAGGSRSRARGLRTVVADGILTQTIEGIDDRTEARASRDIDIGGIDIDLLDEGGDDRARRYREGGYRAAFRKMSRAVNERDLDALEAGVLDHLRLEREHPFDFLAALNALGGARWALGLGAGRRGAWRKGWSGDGGTRRRSRARLFLQAFVTLWSAHPFLPGPDIPGSAAEWASRTLEELGP